ncbi:TM2 domain-containing protein [Actinomyces oricola]|uniref:TM2 domain-containing protein n=1 Tax=Actinomyces oricola TaxID=206043 RepID=UPI0013E8D4C3|nr:TM2 domain-containing protein [Actinomyces oricola]
MTTPSPEGTSPQWSNSADGAQSAPGTQSASGAYGSADPYAAQAGQQAYGQTGYTQDASGQTGYTQDASGQTGYTQDAYGQTGYTQDAYGQSAQQAYPQAGYQQQGYVTEQKSKMAAGLLGIFLGGWGIHNFYLGNTNKGIIQIIVTIVTCGAGALWGLIEGILILTAQPGAQPWGVDANGVPLKE